MGDVLRRRRMTRAFRADPVEGSLIDELIDAARRSPSAGNTAAFEVLVLDRAEDVERYWAVALPDPRRAAFPWPDLLPAPVLLMPCVSPSAYVARYGEADKAGRRAAGPDARRALGQDEHGWTVPYWYVDGGMAVMALLVGAEAAGLGALFFGLFEQEAAICAAFGVPPDWRPLGMVALGWPKAGARQRSRSASRPRPPLDQVVHRGTWRPPGAT